ncbi:MAG: tetratricopeptide repeat protein [Bacteroidales bacterium]|nr:tetratricopeptide repeat protein [Bacteroidales bacterium]MBN2756934.1 tetratricopeptide repeat protein [Bacteroidales bacterium]
MKQTKRTKKSTEISIKSKNKDSIIEAISKKTVFKWLIIIAIFTVVAYFPAFKNEITNWDDDNYVVENPNIKELSKENIKNIFSEYYMGNYHPLSMLSLNIDYQIGGLDKDGEFVAWIYHFTNILLHLLNTLLILWLVYSLFGRFDIAIAASLLFGVNTLHVESVAWISERKDVLYAFFYIASLISYIYYIKNKQLKYYFISILLFILSLLSKGQAVSLAITLFAVDYLFDRKLLDKKVIFEKIPFLILAVVFGIVAIYAQKAGNALHDSNSYEFYKRIGIAAYSFSFYIIKLILPVNLAAIYPYPDIINKTIPAYYWLYVIPSSLVVYVFFYFIKKSKIISFSIAFFVINIFLLLQLIPVGSAIMADRYSYIPSIGFFILTGWFFVKLKEKFSDKKYLAYTILFIYTIGLTALSFQRCKIWENSLVLWNDTIKKSPKAVVAWNNRGSTKDKEKNHKEAIEDFTRAIILKPDYYHAFYNRGTSRKDYAKELSDSNLVKLAIKDFDKAIEIESTFVEAYHNRGLAKETYSELAADTTLAKQRLYEALLDYDKTIELDPLYENAFVNRGVINGKLNRTKEAIDDFNKAIEYDSKNASAYSNRGLAKDNAKMHNEAILDYNKAIEIDAEFVTAYLNRGISYRNLKNYTESINNFTKAIEINPKLSAAYYFRALDKLEINKKNEACADFQIAKNLGHKYAQFQIDKFCK